MRYNVSGNLWLKLLLATLLCLTLWLGWQVAYVIIWEKPPAFQAVKQQFSSSETIFLDRRGREIQRLRTDFKYRSGSWQTLDHIAPTLVKAVINSEDQRFYQHYGVDLYALAAGLRSSLSGQRRGSSTISMQLYSMLVHKGVIRAGKRGINEKIRQIIGAWWLERNWDKAQILEAYLNTLPFRNDSIGVAAASNVLFGKALHGITQDEASILAVLIRAPNASKQLVAKRACWLRRQLSPSADCSQVTMLIDAAFARNSFSTREGIALHASQRAWRQYSKLNPNHNPNQITTSLDASLQQFAVDSLNQQLRQLQPQNVTDGAILVLENQTGAILAYVGSSMHFSQAQEVDFIQAPRQAGSTLKPFLVAQALAEKRLTAASLLLDSAQQFSVGNSLYIPQNYDRNFKGWVTVRRSLASSLNIPSVKILDMVSATAFAEQLKQFGFSLPEPGEYYGLSLALGSLDVNLEQLTNAYRSLANAGHWQALAPLINSSNAAATTTAVIDPAAAFIVADILSDDNARALTFGNDSVLKTSFWTAVKTGTSKDMRDNWAVGFSDQYSVGVWVGNADGKPMHNVSGISGAAPVWRQIMQYLHQDQASQAPQPPANVIQQIVHFELPDKQRIAHLETSRKEYFLDGTQLSQIKLNRLSNLTSAAQPAAAKQTKKAATSASTLIIAPKNGTIIALDPDIPVANQRLLLKTNSLQTGLQWRINGKIVATGNEYRWLPDFGNKTIELIDAEQQLLDSVQLQVRGTPPDWLVEQ